MSAVAKLQFVKGIEEKTIVSGLALQLRASK